MLLNNIYYLHVVWLLIIIRCFYIFSGESVDKQYSGTERDSKTPQTRRTSEEIRDVLQCTMSVSKRSATQYVGFLNTR